MLDGLPGSGRLKLELSAQSRLDQFPDKTFLVSGFKETWPEMPMYFNGKSDHFFSERIALLLHGCGGHDPTQILNHPNTERRGAFL